MTAVPWSFQAPKLILGHLGGHIIFGAEVGSTDNLWTLQIDRRLCPMITTYVTGQLCTCVTAKKINYGELCQSDNLLDIFKR